MLVVCSDSTDQTHPVITSITYGLAVQREQTVKTHGRVFEYLAVPLLSIPLRPGLSLFCISASLFGAGRVRLVDHEYLVCKFVCHISSLLLSVCLVVRTLVNVFDVNLIACVGVSSRPSICRHRYDEVRARDDAGCEVPIHQLPREARRMGAHAEEGGRRRGGRRSPRTTLRCFTLIDDCACDVRINDGDEHDVACNDMYDEEGDGE